MANNSRRTSLTESSEQTSIALTINVSPRKFFPFSCNSPFFARFRSVAYTLKRFSLSLASKTAVESPIPVEQPVTSTILGVAMFSAQVTRLRSHAIFSRRREPRSPFDLNPLIHPRYGICNQTRAKLRKYANNANSCISTCQFQICKISYFPQNKVILTISPTFQLHLSNIWSFFEQSFA